MRLPLVYPHRLPGQRMHPRVSRCKHFHFPFRRTRTRESPAALVEVSGFPPASYSHLLCPPFPLACSAAHIFLSFSKKHTHQLTLQRLWTVIFNNAELGCACTCRAIYRGRRDHCVAAGQLSALHTLSPPFCILRSRLPNTPSVSLRVCWAIAFSFRK
jgi:hypothetical protein